MSETLYRPRDGFIVNLGDDPRTFPATFYFPGTGPESKTCSTCKFFLKASSINRGRCSKWIEHRGHYERLVAKESGNSGWWRGLPCINSATDACKYFEQDPEAAS